MKSKTKINFNLGDADYQRLPHSEGVEQEVLGSILIFTANYSRVYKYLKAEGIFYTPECIEIWEEIQKRIKPGVLSLYDMLLQHYTAIGRNELSAYVQVCYMAATSDSRLIEKCLLLNEYWIGRTIHRLGYHLNQYALKREKDKLDLLGEATDGLNAVYSHIAGMKERTIEQEAKELRSEVVATSLDPGKINGVKSSLYDLNDSIKGYRNGNLIIIGASTGEGKTTLAIQEALHFAKQGIPVGYLSLEMKSTELILMMACCELSMDAERVLAGELSADEMQAFGDTVTMIERLPIMMNDQPAMRIGEIKATARLWHKKGLKVLVVDHIHLANTDTPSPTTEQQFTNIANQLKELGKELDIPVIALAQLARKDDKEKRPHIVTDLKYAGGIEQAADVVLLIFRPEAHGIETSPNGESTKGYARIIVAKVRLIRKRNVTAYFTGQRFADWGEHGFSKAQPVKIDNPRAGIAARMPSAKEEPLPF